MREMDINASALRDQRERPAVLKLQLSSLRSRHPCALVFVLEGREDLKAYESWLRREASDIRWEPIVANGKKNALQFRDMIVRDTTGIGTCTYFIVDHDYDGLDGREGGADVYLLPAHSIENLLIDQDVIATLLKTEFRVLGDPDLRDNLVRKYERARERFCDLVLEACTTLCATRRSACGRVDVAENCLDFMTVTPDDVVCLDEEGLRNLVVTEQALSAEDIERAREFFRERPAAMWVRGKYLASFLRAWGVALMADRRSERPRFFPEPLAGGGLSGEWNEFGSLAAKSPAPEGLIEFVRSAARACEAACCKLASGVAEAQPA